MSTIKRSYVRPEKFIQERTVNITVDPGSTQTRFCEIARAVNGELELTAPTMLKSEYVSIRNINGANQSDPLSHCLEFSITYPEIRGISYEGDIERFARGRTMENYNTTAICKIDSSKFKVNQIELYNTLLSALGTCCMMSDMLTQVYSEKYNINLIMALPPQELSDGEALQRFQDTLKNQFVIDMPHIKRTFTISCRNISIIPEPVAAGMSYLSRNSEERMAVNTAFVEIGGRNRAVSFCINGQLDPYALHADLNGSGDSYLDGIAEDLSRKYQMPKPSSAELISAMKKGKFFKSSVEIPDFQQICLENRKQLAKYAAVCYRNGLSTTGKSETSIAKIVLSGRSVPAVMVKNPDGTVSEFLPSLVELFKRELRNDAIIVEAHDHLQPVLDGVNVHALREIDRLEQVVSDNVNDEEDFDDDEF